MARVVLDNVTKRYGDVTALDRITLEVADKEFLVLVGPSGCGKSTALRIIAGLEEITEGDVFIGEKRANGVAPKDRNISMVFQNYALYPNMNVYNNMAYGLRLRKYPKKEVKERVLTAAGLLGIERLLHRKPAQLSGGERQRVAVGRAIVRDPQVFLFDEPLSNLDAKLRVHMRKEIKKLSRRIKTTMIYVTHDQVEAMTMGDRIVVMKDGVIQQVGTPLEVYHSPSNLFVAGFIGSPPMNFIPCILERLESRIFARTDGFRLPIPDSKSSLVTGDVIEAVLGIRPEDIHCTGAAFQGEEPKKYERIRLSIDFIEPLGADILLNARSGNDTVVLRSSNALEVSHDGELDAVIDIEKIYLFDKTRGERFF
jgi:multiple sugar transport system ATP-binding protein